jgi:hypothetical protein
MPATTVRATTTFEAVHLSAPDWKDVLVGWLRGFDAPEEHIDQELASAEENLGALDFQPWLVKTDSGVVPVPPANFVEGFEDLNATSVLDDIWRERKTHHERGYTAAHDDNGTTAHLINQAVFRLGPLSNATNILPDAVKREELVKAGSLIVAAIDKMDRAQSVRTFSVD